MWAYQVLSEPEWAMTTIQAGSLPSAQLYLTHRAKVQYNDPDEGEKQRIVGSLPEDDRIRVMGLLDGDVPEEMEEKLEDLKVTNCSSHPLGVRMLDDKGKPIAAVIIPANTPLPYEKTEVFATAKPNQITVDLSILQGEDVDPDSNAEIGRVQITDLPPLPAGSKIDVTFRYDEDGRVTVTAKDRKSGRAASTTIERASGLDKAAVDAEQSWVEEIKLD
jgi:molecular chaperone DnaK (HSP70)